MNASPGKESELLSQILGDMWIAGQVRQSTFFVCEIWWFSHFHVPESRKNSSYDTHFYEAVR